MTKYVAAFSSLLLAAGIAALAMTPARGSDSTLARLLSGDPCNSAAPTPSSPQASAVRIGTFNIRAGTTTQDFSAGVHAFLPYVDVAGLQETNSKDKARVLANLSSSGWSFYRQYRTDIPHHLAQGGAEQEPVLWRSDRFVCTYAGPAFLSGIYSMNGELPYFDGTRRYWFTVVRLVDRVSGQRIAILNVHLIPGVIMSGVPMPGLPRHWAVYKTQLANVVAMTQRQQGWGKVYVLGDFNSGWVQDEKHRHAHLPFRSFRAVGYRSMWATERPTNGLGTRSISLIDQVWSTDRATSAKVVFALQRYSDHRPAVARYRLGAVPAG